MVNRITIFILVQLTSGLLIAQSGESELDSVTVFAYRISQPGVTTLPKKRIENRLATDIGQLMTLFPGMQLRSYGGLGGLKTVSFRSLGANHTSVIIDRFALSQTQSGQTDLGQIPVDFIQKIEVVNQAGTSINYPVHSKLSGQIIALETRHLPTFNDSFQLNLGAQTGSFGQVDVHTFISKSWKKIKLAASGKYRQFEGNYPFSYMNGQQRVSTTRNNGDLQDVFGNFSVTYMPDSLNEFHLNTGISDFKKGLPGAVVFYNPSAGQRLYGANQLATLRHRFKKRRFEIGSGISYQQGALDYVDSNYLNSQGYLHSHFFNKQIEGSSQAKLIFGIQSSHEMLLGAEIRNELLESEDLAVKPVRNTIDGILAYKFRKKGTSIAVQSGLTTISDQRTGNNSFAKTYLQPLIDFSQQLGRNFTVSGGGKYTVRQPTFSELYYNQIGNDDLRPEKAYIAWIRTDYLKISGKTIIRTGIQPFFVYAQDKILAIPTKNLFIWSIQNIGISNAFGTEFTASATRNFDRSAIGLNLNYTYQYTQDLSDPESPTYANNLAYNPLHSGTAEISYERKKTGISILGSYQGERYTLNQNIPANLLEGFFLLDASVYYRFFISRRKSQLTMRLAANNLTNNYYSYIRYFVMPGTNWAIRMSYEF